LNNVFAGGVEYVDLPPRNINWQEEFQNLPYIFKDPIKIDKKVDPRLVTFGSNVSQKQLASPVEYYSVKEIISPEILVLNNGVKVKLIGVKEKAEKKKEAMEFLRLKTKGQKVVLRFDNQKYDQEGNLLVYMYLKNKTFLNAHLIKLKLADVDDSFEYKFKSRFITYAG
ncbi:MAG: modification methylase, partial [Eubacteriales bacterium]|nr:modification methylase [Eubacteriales bacterium]